VVGFSHGFSRQIILTQLIHLSAAFIVGSGLAVRSSTRQSTFVQASNENIMVCRHFATRRILKGLHVTQVRLIQSLSLFHDLPRPLVSPSQRVNCGPDNSHDSDRGCQC
jgi:hypothetical protein